MKRNKQWSKRTNNEQTNERANKQKNKATKIKGKEIAGCFGGTGIQSAAQAGNPFKF